MAEVFFDLSELFLNSKIKFKYYGIARTVMEVAYELSLIDNDIRYVIYSPLHRRFFEVFPRIGERSPTGVLDPNIPDAATPLRLRQNNYGTNSFWKRQLYKLAHRWADFINARRWARIESGAVKEVDLQGQILVALGRPKILSDYLFALQKEGVQLKFVPLLHDMIPLHNFSHRNQFSFPKNFLYDNRVVINAASLVLTNSEFTASEVRHFSQAGILPPVEKVVAVPLCYELRSTSEPIEKVSSLSRYLLCVGAYNGRKNLECVVEAMLMLHESGLDVPDLLLAGARRKRVEKFIKNKRFAALQEKIHFIFDPNQSELERLYRNAFALVLPSRMEGWGLPVSEALWCGTPALAADVPALREAGGDLGLYFDPDRPAELAEIIKGLWTDPQEYETLRTKIAQSKPGMRKWHDVAAEILQAIRNL
nr:glycosyltransferase family 1 protein [uncultured Agrobacterium sp.]